MRSCLLVKSFDFMHESKDSILSLLSDRAGIQDDDIGFCRIDDFSQSCSGEDHLDFFTVGIVHLASESFDEKSLHKKVFYNSRGVIVWKKWIL